MRDEHQGDRCLFPNDKITGVCVLMKMSEAFGHRASVILT